MGELWDWITHTEIVEVPAMQFTETVAHAQIVGWHLLSYDGTEAMLRWDGNPGHRILFALLWPKRLRITVEGE